MAPITEEISFRACSVPLLAHCLGNNLTIFVAPISFSFSHIHHLIEDRKRRISLSNAFASRVFQMLYTYLFGLYATYIFFQTG
ncbi:unnamed protein product [Meloidogyne enterolobii]|uniref:Uncharacterized protein n=1 Tax=Meloidogyne enterolobii TaxID=390850 RepID=A0ACB0Y4C3_MELEN